MNIRTNQVAPYVGAWIETFDLFKDSFNISVAPYVGAWIETRNRSNGTYKVSSHPTWVRGLKHKNEASANASNSRTLRGCVD